MRHSTKKQKMEVVKLDYMKILKKLIEIYAEQEQVEVKIISTN